MLFILKALFCKELKAFMGVVKKYRKNAKNPILILGLFLISGHLRKQLVLIDFFNKLI